MPVYPNKYFRKNIRLKDFDYSEMGMYFITICASKMCQFFGVIRDSQMILSDLGKIAAENWESLPNHFPQIEVISSVIMPNHTHSIIKINNVAATLAVANPLAQQSNAEKTENTNVGKAGASPAATMAKAGASPAATMAKAGASPAATNGNNAKIVKLGEIVGAYKSRTYVECLKLYKSQNKYLGQLWQHNYYEHIIRDEESFLKIAEYIENNPLKWNEDKYYPVAATLAVAQPQKAR